MNHRWIKKSQPSSSDVHVPSAGYEKKNQRRDFVTFYKKNISKVLPTDVSPPLNNLEARMINSAFSSKEDDDASTSQPTTSTSAVSKINKSDASSTSPRRVSTVAVRHGPHLLMGKRRDNGKWTTPGGHLNDGEKFKDGALRELQEESGLKLKPHHLKALGSVKKITDKEGKPLHVQGFEAKLRKKPSTTMKTDPDGEVERWHWINVEKGLPEHVENNLHVPLKNNVLMKGLNLGKGDDDTQQVLVPKVEADPATADDAQPRTGVSRYDMLPSDLALAMDALGYHWSDATTSGKGNQEFYPSQGALVKKQISKKIQIAKINKARQILYCVVLPALEQDSQDDVMEPEDIEESAHNYLIKSRIIGSEHSKPISAAPVESYIAPMDLEWEGQYGKQTVKKGSWVIAIKIFDPKEWEKVLDGSYTGVSVGGLGLRKDIN